MLTDLRFVFRALMRNRMYTGVTVFTLALGIGAAAAIFTVVDWVLFRANDFPHDVYIVGGQTNDTPFMAVRFDFMLKAYEQTPAAEFAKAVQNSGNVVVAGEPVTTRWIGVSPNLFPMLGVTPALGRNFLRGEDKPGADQEVIVSHSFWRSHLGASPDALGQKITVGDAVCTVVGVLKPMQVMPGYFYSEVYRPLHYVVDPKTPWLPNLFVLAKLPPGISVDQATAMLRGAKYDLPDPLRMQFASDRVVLTKLVEANSRIMRADIYWMMLGAVAFLYAIACLNASNLLLVRMFGQQRELSIRLALGATRARVLRLLLLESVTLSLAGAIAGALLANWLFPLLIHAAGNQFVGTNWRQWNLSWGAIAVMAALTAVTSVVITAAPAWRLARAEIYAGVKEGGAARGESRSVARLRSAIVVLQTMFAVVLLSGAMLMIRTFQQLRQVDLGFDPEGKVKVQLSFQPSVSTENQARLARLREIAATLGTLPGVRAVGFGNDVVLPGFYFPNSEIVGGDGQPLKTSILAFGDGFQDAAGLRLRRGAWLTHKKGDDVLVTEALARKLWPDADPIGQFIRKTHRDPKASKDWLGWRVVGVVADMRANTRENPGLYIYGPETWGPGGFNTFVVQVSTPFSESFVGALRRALYAFDPQLVVGSVTPLTQIRDTQLWAEHMADSVLKVLAAVAALLTVIGLFSVLAYTVDCRMPEFGVRMALGATERDLITLVATRGVLLAAGGLACGLAVAFGLTRYLQSLLFQTSAADPYVISIVCGLLLLSALAACAWPAYRATKVDVARLLRAE